MRLSRTEQLFRFEVGEDEEIPYQLLVLRNQRKLVKKLHAVEREQRSLRRQIAVFSRRVPTVQEIDSLIKALEKEGRRAELPTKVSPKKCHVTREQSRYLLRNRCRAVGVMLSSLRRCNV